MRLTILIAASALAIASGARAEGTPDCKGFKGRYVAMLAEVEKRAPGVETERMRENAEAYLTACLENDDRLRSIRPACTIVDGRPICADE